MSYFCINACKVEMTATDIEQLRKELEKIGPELLSLGNNIAFQSGSTDSIKTAIKGIAGQIEDETGTIERLSNALLNITAAYGKHEQNIIDNIGGLQSKDRENNSFRKEENNDPGEGDRSVQEAIDLLNNLSMSTSIDGVVLAIIEYLIKLYNIAADTAIIGTLGHGAGIAGLITGVAADILYALDNGSSSNALIADIIVDIGLWGVGEGVSALGSAVGTAVGGPVGTVVGNFVGGLVGNGVSIAMNVDWNGDAEGGVGKDALSDWIDNQLDKFINDAEFEAVI